jgi:Lhr-like helicase
MKKEQNKDYKKNKIDLIKKAFKENKQKEEIFIDFILKQIKYTFSQEKQMLKILENENDKNFFIDDIFKQSSDKHIEFFFDSFVPLKTFNKDIKNKIYLIKKAFKEDKEMEEAFIDSILDLTYEEDLEKIDSMKKFISKHEINKEYFFNDTFNKQNDKAIEKFYKMFITSK